MPHTGVRLDHSFFAQPTRTVAKQLLGKRLVRVTDDGMRLSGFIVEVEAYLSAGDLASHSNRGSTKKCASMFLAPGTLYVYPIHAKYCMNVVTDQTGKGAAVLIRALEPSEGVERMLQLRRQTNALAATSGPARLCQALDIDRRYDGIDLINHPQIWLEEVAQLPFPGGAIRRGPRIGISQSRSLPLRWFFDGHRFVSGRGSAHSQGRHWTFF